MGFKRKRKVEQDQEKKRELERFREDRREKQQRINNQRNGGSNSGVSIPRSDLRSLAKERELRQKQNDAVVGGSGDPTKMPGEENVTRIRYYELFPSAMYIRSRSAQRHLANINNALRLRPHPVTLKRAQYVCNPMLLQRFETLRLRLTNHHVVYLFHGTGKENVTSIAEKGFLGKHAQSGGTLIWFSRQSTYSYAFTASMGKGLSRGGGPMGGGPGGNGNMMHPSGRMFVCALLVASGKSSTSNIGDNGQDVITMTSEVACLPLYIIDTTSTMQNNMKSATAMGMPIVRAPMGALPMGMQMGRRRATAGMAMGGVSVPAFAGAGKGRTLGGQNLKGKKKVERKKKSTRTKGESVWH